MRHASSLVGFDAFRHGIKSPLRFTMAFQPIVDVEASRVFAYEALVRGPEGQSAASILDQVTDANRYNFDQLCRIRAITLASRLRVARTGARLSMNFMPGSVCSTASCIQLTLKTASECGIAPDRLIFEITEAEKVRDPAYLRKIVSEYRRYGFQVALDDFGAGYCGLNLLADLPTDIVKLDMNLTRDLNRRPKALAIVRQMVELAHTLGISIIAEGIENLQEYDALRTCGIHLMQGYLFAKPALEALPPFSLPEDRRMASKHRHPKIHAFRSVS
jgi:EAL domain-containing protein (putative c-di-GMP-specific phosphodiesterase class I)